jgi:alkylhydroperoxidase/carboxymuconolactone decarboxylase family protein YurZ
MFEASRGDLAVGIAELTAITCHAARRSHAAMRLHLPRAFAAGITAAMVAEALSFLLLPAGGPILIDAVQCWADAHDADPAHVAAPYVAEAASS